MTEYDIASIYSKPDLVFYYRDKTPVSVIKFAMNAILKTDTALAGYVRDHYGQWAYLQNFDVPFDIIDFGNELPKAALTVEEDRVHYALWILK